MKKMIPFIAVIIMFAACQKDFPVTDKSSTAALVTDINEPCEYPFVYIHGQRWMATNLAVTHYRNGDRIPHVRNKTKWANLTTGAWCWYKNDSATYAATYGKLYNWYAVHDPRGLAPIGWHIPSDVEWDTLSAHLKGGAGGKLKDTGTIEAGTGLWHFPNKGASNSTGFTGLPGGLRSYNGTFNYIGYYGYWWSTSKNYTFNAWTRYLYYGNGFINRFNYNKQVGLSVRCLMD